MADHSSPFETALPTDPGRPLLSALARWWPGASATPATEVVLGYECALPWTLEDPPHESVEPS